MRQSRLFLKTLRANPKDETSVNAQLLIRGGFIEKLMAGSYTLLPLGFRVHQKVVDVVRQEMNALGASEVLMPLLHPKEVWSETGRWDDAGVKQVMYQFKDSGGRELGLSFTHEEVVLDLARKRGLSYQNLPIKIYHFSTKFRNEPRAKSGLLRTREFIMKDLYSLHASREDLDNYYHQVKEAYLKIFGCLGLKALVVEAGGGVFTQEHTHEFQVLNPAGEDTVFHCRKCHWAQNKEIFNAGAGDKCPQCGGAVEESPAIEVGNIFKFGTTYSEKMNVNYTAQDGSVKPVWFASYGLGTTRLIGALVEASHDDKGIVWPKAASPFLVHLIVLEGGQGASEKIYAGLGQAGFEVLYDDRDESAGVKLADADLIGLPFRVVVSEKTLSQDSVEIKARAKEEAKLVKIEKLAGFLNGDK